MNADASSHGCFPFGRPNSERPMRRTEATARALVVGVYPSAFHVAWSPAHELDPRPVERRRQPLISALAVDVEPTVFWDGVTPTPSEQLDRWRNAVGFDEARHGRVSVGTNGPSGAGLMRQILEPLRLEADHVSFTDAVPWFFVKSGTGSQGDAIDQRFNPIARTVGIPEGTLPRRPSVSSLVKIAASAPRREMLRAEILDAHVDMVITLGQEASDAILRVADKSDSTPRSLTPDETYGRPTSLTINYRQMEWLALAHPGFIRQTTNARWLSALDDWNAWARAR